MNVILELKGIKASYYKKEVLHGIDMVLREREILLLIGTNGAGKSTLLKTISGLLLPREGRIYYKRRDITKLSVFQRVKLGIRHFLQGGEVFGDLTVLENLEVAGLNYSRNEIKQRLEEVWDLFPELYGMRDKKASFLSGGERQMLALASLFMGKFELLLIDEPSAGLSPVLVGRIYDKIKLIVDKYKIPVILVEQNIRYGLEIADRVVVLHMGKIIKEGDARDFRLIKNLEKIIFGEA